MIGFLKMELLDVFNASAIQLMLKDGSRRNEGADTGGVSAKGSSTGDTFRAGLEHVTFPVTSLGLACCETWLYEYLIKLGHV